jgi:hypothetical protein
MSLQGIQYLDESWTLNNQLTINANVEVLGDLNTTGFIYDGGVPVNIQGTNNVWTAENEFSVSLPTFLNPVANNEMATKDYLDTAVVGLGAGLLPLNNVWTGVNAFQALPSITNPATLATAQMINKAGCDAIVASSTGSLATNNLWSAQQSFNGVMTVPTPLTDPEFANKLYVDTAISAFNASGGKIEYVEVVALGATSLTCDPATYSGCMICMIASGGFGANTAPPVITGATVKSFGGAGGYAVFKLPSWTGNATLTMTNSTLTSTGSAVFTLATFGTNMVTCTSGGNGSQLASGVGGTVSLGAGFSGVQIITGSVEPLQSPTITDNSITKSYNYGCLNGFGCGGSYRYDTGTQVSPTVGYCLQIKYRN